MTRVLSCNASSFFSANALSAGTPELSGMGKYLPGDVLLASVALDDRTLPKTRPVVVIRTAEPEKIHVLPVSSKPPSDAPCLPLSIDDFASGGLDLFEESYILTARVVVIRINGVIGKKGRLRGESLAAITRQIPEDFLPGSQPVQKKPGRSSR